MGNYSLAINNGLIFKYAAEVLSKKQQRRIQELLKSGSRVANLDASLTVPVIVNSAFACELFMKSMLPENKIPKNGDGHKLACLFKLLEDDIQENIRNITIDKMKNFNSSYNSSDFQNDLDKSNNVFVEWRYFHEGNSKEAAVNFIQQFMNTLFSVAKDESSQ